MHKVVYGFRAPLRDSTDCAGVSSIVAYPGRMTSCAVYDFVIPVTAHRMGSGVDSGATAKTALGVTLSNSECSPDGASALESAPISPKAPDLKCQTRIKTSIRNARGPNE